jgi:tripartite motif-containing protein 71
VLGAGLFSEPAGVAADATGHVYVTDSGAHHVTVLSPFGEQLARWGTPGSAPGQLQSPNGIALDAAGNVYVVDAGNHRVQKFGPGGAPLAQWGEQGSAPGQLSSPTGVAVDTSGTVYVTDTGNNRIQRFDGTGKLVGVWGPGETVPPQIAPSMRPGRIVEVNGQIYGLEFQAPTGLSLVGDTIHVVNSAQRMIFSLRFMGPLRIGTIGIPECKDNAAGLAADGAGNLFVADAGVTKLGAGRADFPQHSISFEEGSAPGQFRGHRGIALDPSGNLYVADSGNGRVQALSAGSWEF